MKYTPKHLRKSHKVKKYILNGITTFMFFLFWFSICAVDSESWIPLILVVVSLVWLWGFAWANDGKCKTTK